MNRGTRFCRPLRNHSATWPLRSADAEFEITIRRALRQAGYTGATPGGQPFGKAGGLDPRNEVPATHSASLRAFTLVFDGLWTRVTALILGIQSTVLFESGSPLLRGRTERNMPRVRSSG